ncbi:MAG: heavy metal-binding domain-containing protein, partial [Alphaproteobacteria bacterium]|nr:heavy metal-binding domain-containing protein [Alphaproteobacteria bacterium]
MDKPDHGEGAAAPKTAGPEQQATCHQAASDAPTCHEPVPEPATCHEHGDQGAAQAAPTGAYICPMCPGVSSDTPGTCPKCGMALEPAHPVQPAAATVYSCPMHPEVTKDAPGECPICGMALEATTVAAEEGPNSELIDMTRRFWISLIFTVPVLILAMGEMMPIWPEGGVFGAVRDRWLQFALATPVMLWCGAPFFVRGWA